MFLATYSKSEFYNHNWDEVTKNCRGHVYDSKGNLIADPMSKIFNLGEVEETSAEAINNRLATMKCGMSDKYNGHLSILFKYDNEFINMTKGSWNHEFVEPDRKILNPIIERLKTLPKEIQSKTFCFEIIGSHDKHLLWDTYVERDLNDKAILIYISGVNPIDSLNKEIKTSLYTKIGHELNCPVANYYENMCTSYEDLLEITKCKGDIEGFVFMFEDGYMFKVKTDEYLKERFKNKFMDGKEIKKLYFRHWNEVHEIFEQIPEEFYGIVTKLDQDFDKYIDQLEDKIKEKLFSKPLGEHLIEKSVYAKEIFLSKDIPEKEKHLMCQVLRNDKINRKGLLKEFLDSYEFDNEMLKAERLFD